MDNLRVVEKKDGTDWIRCRLAEIKKGDIFRMFEDDEPVIFNSKTEFIALSDADKTGVEI